MFKNDFCFTTWLMSSFHLLKIWVINYDDIQYWASNESKRNLGSTRTNLDQPRTWPDQDQEIFKMFRLIWTDQGVRGTLIFLLLDFFQIISTWALPQMKIRSLDSFSLVSHDLILSHDSESRDVLSLYHMMSLHVS